MIREQNLQTIEPIDMSPDAIEQRLRDLAQLYKLGMAIDEARGDARNRNLFLEPQRPPLARTPGH